MNHSRALTRVEHAELHERFITAAKLVEAAQLAREAQLMKTTHHTPGATPMKHEEPDDLDADSTPDETEGEGEGEGEGEETNEGSCEECDGSCEESDEVNEPNHYCMGKVQCVDAIEAAVVGLVGIEAFFAGNVIKYLWRHEWKDGSKDLAKCHWYLCALMEARATREAEEAAHDEVDADDDSEAGEDVDDGDESDEPKSKPDTKHHE